MNYSHVYLFLKYHLWKSNINSIAILATILFPVFLRACTPCNCLFVQTLLVENYLCLYPSPLSSLLYSM